MIDIKAFLKQAKKEGKTSVKLNAKFDELCAEFLRLTIPLFPSAETMLKAGFRGVVIDKKHPEWRSQPIEVFSDSDGVYAHLGCGSHSKVVAKHEFVYYSVLSTLHDDLNINGVSGRDVAFAAG